jgi:hypothetical protein
VITGARAEKTFFVSAPAILRLLAVVRLHLNKMPAKARSTRTKEEVQGKKLDYIKKVQRLLEEYPRFLIVTCDNIGSKLMQEIRLSLRPSGSVLLMGKNVCSISNACCCPISHT